MTAPARCGGLRGMSASAADFPEIVGAVLRRFFAQNARTPPPPAESAALAARLSALIAERGLPRPLAPGEIGAPGGIAEAECAPLVARVAGAGAPPLLAEAARQLVKACFYPEFTVCRDSLSRVRRRWRVPPAGAGARARPHQRGALRRLPALGRAEAGGTRGLAAARVARGAGDAGRAWRDFPARGLPRAAALAPRDGAPRGLTRVSRFFYGPGCGSGLHFPRGNR